jgi:hypothetical protein
MGTSCLRLSFVIGISAVLAACGGKKGGGGVDAGGGGGPDGSIPIADGGAVDAPIVTTPDAAVIDANRPDVPNICKLAGDPCTLGAQCCSKSCDPNAHQCVATCADIGSACNTAADCCSLSCNSGTHMCSATCTSNTGTCGANGDCCSNNCQGTTCAPVQGALCTTLGNSCTQDSECCSKYCDGTGHCEPAAGPSGCNATGDICYLSSDCCTGLCTFQPGATAGLCTALTTTGSGNCTVDGEPCTDGNGCCSKVCALQPSGVSICQVASGCRVIGDVCQKASDCCGGDKADSCGLQTTCNIVPGSVPEIGTCSNPSGQDPQGDICGLGVSARHDCCGCASPKINCCKPDLNGVDRCFGTPKTGNCPNGYDGTTGCCILPHQTCTFSAECCDGNPCVPDPVTGVLQCGLSCSGNGGVCTTTGDCCSGLECEIPPGSLAGTCGKPFVPPPDAGIAGVPDAMPATADAGVCSLSGQKCSTTTPCCGNLNLVCEDSTTGNLCASGQTNCTCLIVIP